MATTTWQVQGMTCQHCVRAVTEEVSSIDGVRGVEVHLETGRVDIDSDVPITAEALAEAVSRAGYELVP